MDLEGITLSGISRSETHTWNLKNKANKIETDSDTESRLVVGCQRAGGWGRGGRGEGLRRTDWQVQHSHGDAQCSIGDRGNDRG